MSLAAKLKELRRKNGESLQKVADAVGVSKAHIWELEKGTSKNPGLDLLTKLSAHFSVPVSFLTDEAASPKDAAAQQFFREFDGKLSDKDWDVLRAMAERLKGDET
jgi:transcriptional regulator with XRE-family HTH domain